jgi:hypothetical protein
MIVRDDAVTLWYSQKHRTTVTGPGNPKMVSSTHNSRQASMPAVEEQNRMVDHSQAKELIARLLDKGEQVHPSDLTMFYAWIYSSYIALEPFPSEHRRFRQHCMDSFDPPRRRLRVGRHILRLALEQNGKNFVIKAEAISENYMRLLERALASKKS